MKQYIVTGMTCAACVARVEKAVSKVPGVASCSVSLLTNSMGVEGSVEGTEIVKAVTDAGYQAREKNSEGEKTYSAGEEALADHETPKLKKRLTASVLILLVLMYFSMGYNMWGFPVPGFFEENYIALGILQLLLSAMVMVINQKFFISGFKSAIHLSPNMDTLVAMGSAVSFLYSTVALFAMTVTDKPGHLMHEFYFETAAMILTLITVGKMLEARSKGRTTDALKSLMKLAPKTAVLVRDGAEETVPVGQVKSGDVFVVRPGENIPVDGMILEGNSAINEAALTGESIPVDKKAGDPVSAATLNQSGFIRCEATRVGEDTTLSQIIRMVSDAAATKAPVAKTADRVAGVFVPVVLAIALLTFIVWLFLGESAGNALSYGIAVLVISCPCSLGLATPVAIMVGNGMGAKNGILFKTAASIEETGKIQVVALDKTGTITSGEPVVTDVIPADADEQELMRLACALEKRSEHPLAKAVLKRAEELQIEPPEAEDFTAMPGNGLKAVVDGEQAVAGKYDFAAACVEIPAQITQKAEELAAQGKTPLFFAKGKKLMGMIAVADTIKEESPKAVKELRNMGIRVVMLTGDNERTAKAIGQAAGVDEVIAGVMPQGKEEVIRKLQNFGKVAMVGDGINDAPALTRADIGIAIGAGTDVAIDAADIVLMKSRLTDVPAAVRLSRATLRNIHENLFWAFFYNAIGIPLAAGVFSGILGWKLNPMFGAAAMSLSSVCVVTNALRLNLFKIHDAAGDKKVKNINQNQKENKTMTKTMKIEGMMCEHCEARVKKALLSIEGVSDAAVSHEQGNAVVTLAKDVSDETLKDIVEAQDYKVVTVGSN